MPLAAKTRPTLPQLAWAIAICLGAGSLGAFFTASALQSWYPSLQKPPITPPNWVFGPVWTVLYLLMGVSLAYLWAVRGENQRKKRALIIFWIQLGFNVAWSAAFFGLRSPGWGYAIIIALWLTIAALLWVGSKLSSVAAWLLVPYFLWVTYASALNFGILSLNVIRPKVELMDADKKNQDAYFKVKNPFADRKKAEERQRAEKR